MTNLETILTQDWAKRPPRTTATPARAIAASTAASDFLISLSFCALTVAAFMVLIVMR